MRRRRTVREVTAVIELRARFDEQNNIDWSERLEDAGCRVIYGFSDYKIHSKVCLITLKGKSGIQYVTQIGTGNYNEKTSEQYTDLSLITADQGIGRDAAEFFQKHGCGQSGGQLPQPPGLPLQPEADHPPAHRGRDRPGQPRPHHHEDELPHRLRCHGKAGRGLSCRGSGRSHHPRHLLPAARRPWPHGAHLRHQRGGALLEHSRIYSFGSERTSASSWVRRT